MQYPVLALLIRHPSVPLQVSQFHMSVVRERTEHFGGKDDTETSITDNFTVGVTDGSLIASLSVRRGNFDDLVGVIRYLSACPSPQPVRRPTSDLDAIDCRIHVGSGVGIVE